MIHYFIKLPFIYIRQENIGPVIFLIEIISKYIRNFTFVRTCKFLLTLGAIDISCLIYLNFRGKIKNSS